MSEREAWLRLAGAWDEAKKCRNGKYYAIACGKYVYGLCMSMMYLHRDEKISDIVRDEMEEKIDALPSIDEGNYKWPLTREGAAARAAFCRERAAELEVAA